ncbi:hypothetical protein BS50DRAFT_575766 [Corynespora cassiicola Philippines]|uniref:Cora-domain-containing protein n=1 Tax=Corynespora cassiicola Philippines TaxID=1448308 RepID=A0A2T2NGD0_CORCC|nr:hypothetical protein BS50DRAFT_575766 [Corynespora cassiicola Philippines]
MGGCRASSPCRVSRLLPRPPPAAASRAQSLHLASFIKLCEDSAADPSSIMAAPPKRSRSDPPPPITVEDTATGTEPQPSPSPTSFTGRPFSSFAARPKPPRRESNSREQRRQGASEKAHKRTHSPNVEWHDKWTKDLWKQGRVLLIDYVDKEHTKEGKTKVVAQEFHDVEGLRKFYRDQDLSAQAALRVIHVQNATWATRFLLKKFNINSSDDLVGTTFARWAKYERPRRRGGKPVLNGKTFRTQRDPWRGISRASFGCDYLRQYEKHKIADESTGMKMMELNHYDALDQPTYGYDVYAQRFSVYVQLSDGEPGVHVDDDVRNPYNEEQYEEYQRLRRQYEGPQNRTTAEPYIPKLETLDNGSTIILFEYAQSGSPMDTLIGARQEIESRWRRLTFYMSKEEMENDERLAISCMDLILRDIFKSLSFTWERYLNCCETHVGILEDKIYENPADESRAPELWTNASLWLKVERLLYLHTDIVKEMRNHLRQLSDGDPREGEVWLGNTAEELAKLTTQFEEGVTKPTDNLSDLMYKMVGIRDARYSLQLGVSMWRLSWITFIFLPLTFVCGFFGMNVDTFEGNPSIKWWFVVTFPLFAVIMVSWYIVKHSVASQRQDPLRRGVYENLYFELAGKHPGLWTRGGPRDGIVPIGWWNGIKWNLITSWFSADKTVRGKAHDGYDELGVWSRTKRYLVQRWLGTLTVLSQQQQHAGPSVADLESAFDDGGEMSPVDGPDPTAASKLHKRSPFARMRSLSPTRTDGSRHSSDGASGVMVEEKGGSEDERSGDDEGVGMAGVQRHRLHVPVYTRSA